MERKRVNGRFAKEASSEEPVARPSGRASRSRHAKSIGEAREKLIEAIPAIAATLVRKARLGSIPHMKLLLDLLGIDRGGLGAGDNRPAEKTLEEILTEKWEKVP